MMTKILYYSIPIHSSVEYIDLREGKMLIIKSFEEVIEELLKEVVEELVKKLEESIEEQICWLTDVIAFPERTTKYENVIFHIAKPEVLPKAFRFNTKAAINDFLKNPAIALNDCKDLHIYERPKKNDMYSCYNFLKYSQKRYFCYKNGNDQLFIRNDDSFHKKSKPYSEAQNSILFSKFKSGIEKWLFSEKTAQSVALMCS